MEPRFHLLGAVGLEGDDAAALAPLAGRKRLYARLVASLQDAVGQIAQTLLDVLDADRQHELEAGQARVMAAHRPGPRLQPASVIGKDQLPEREGEGVAGREPARALR